MELITHLGLGVRPVLVLTTSLAWMNYLFQVIVGADKCRRQNRDRNSKNMKGNLTMTCHFGCLLSHFFMEENSWKILAPKETAAFKIHGSRSPERGN